MSTRDKSIKILAISLGMFLIAIILSVILNIVSLLLGIHYINNGNEVSNEEIFLKDKSITSIDIDLNYTSLDIRTGDEFKIDKKIIKDNIDTKTEGNVLKIEEKNNLFWRNNGIVTIYVPKNKEVYSLKVSLGAGKLSIDNISADTLKLDLGAGHSNINNSSFGYAEIESGAGKLSILNTTLKNLNADFGVGHTDLEAYILGNSEIDAGVGKLDMKLLGNRDDYKIEIEKGLGATYIDGQSQNLFGNGRNKIKIDGGVGCIDVSFKN